MTDADTDSGVVTPMSNVSPIRKQFPASKVPKELPLKRTVLAAIKEGTVQIEPVPLISDFEYEQVTYLKNLKQEIAQYVESATVSDSTMLKQTENSVATVLSLMEYMRGRCTVRGIKKQHAVAIVGLVLLELKYNVLTAGKLVGSSSATLTRIINEYGWLEPEVELIQDIHGFFFSQQTRERINPPLVDLRQESWRLESLGAEYSMVAPVPPVNIAAIMRSLRAGMDITVEGTPEHDQMADALFVLVGLAVRRGAPMLTLGWAVNVHHNTIRKYAQRSPVASFSLGVKGSKEQKAFEKRQKALLSGKEITDDDTDNEFINVIVHDTRTPAIIVKTLSPVPQEIGMVSRPKLRMLRNVVKNKKEISTAVLGNITQYRAESRDAWQRETMNNSSVSSLFPEKDADLKTDIANNLLIPTRKARTDEVFSVCEIEVALVSLAGAYGRDGDMILKDGETVRALLPLNPLTNLVHLIPNNSLEDANKYCRSVEEYLKISNITDEENTYEDDEDLRQVLTDNRATELKRYTPAKYHHLIDPNMFDETSMIWKAICNPGHLVDLTTAATSSSGAAVEFDKTIPSLGVVEEGGRIRPPKKRKGGPYARK